MKYALFVLPLLLNACIVIEDDSGYHYDNGHHGYHDHHDKNDDKPSFIKEVKDKTN